MMQKIKSGVWQFKFKKFSSHVYLIKLGEKNILIDAGSFSARDELLKYLKELNIKPQQIDIILITHNHWDHVENLNLFPNAKIYGNKKDFPENKKIIDIAKLKIKEIRTIKTPGHSKESICFYIPKEKILFSGDTLFHRGYIGRTDLPGGDQKEIEESLNKLKKLDYEILCPGHGVE